MFVSGKIDRRKGVPDATRQRLLNLCRKSLEGTCIPLDQLYPDVAAAGTAVVTSYRLRQHARSTIAGPRGDLGPRQSHSRCDERTRSVFMNLLSTDFLLFAIGMVVVVNLLKGKLRQLVYLTGNLTFLFLLLLEPVGAMSTLTFCLAGYVFLRLIDKSPKWGFRLGITLLTIAFLYMRDYSFLRWGLPDSWRTDAMKTIGLSFMLFRTIHVLVEARSQTLGRYDLISYLNYNLSFVTLLSGPIQRFQDFRDQWEGKTQAIPLTLEAHLDAIIRILIGFVKVYVIGDRLLGATLSAQGPIEDLSFTSVLVGFYIFYPFLYFNFSGYCDIVIGFGSLLGVRPPENFDKPFLATNISEYWLRVHRSLTLWLTDYVFSPLYKQGLSSTLLGRFPLLVMSGALMATMFVSGIWHGTTGSFVVFGLLHGLFQVMFRVWDWAIAKRWGKKRVREWRAGWLSRGMGIFITFHAASFAYLFFDLDTSDAWMVINKLILP